MDHDSNYGSGTFDEVQDGFALSMEDVKQVREHEAGDIQVGIPVENALELVRIEKQLKRRSRQDRMKA